MGITKSEMKQLAELVAETVVTTLEKRGLIGKVEKPRINDRTAYAKTESLLYNYNGFKKIVAEKMAEIEEIRVHGVPQRCGTVGDGIRGGNVQQGIVLPEESVEMAVHRIEESVRGTVDAIALIDKCMVSLKGDPYYRVLEMRYFEGRTQEDIAVEFGCSQVTISNNKSRLVRELSMRLFPNQVVNEMLN